jgi:hypothetical protein
MTPKEKAKELFDKMKGFRVKHSHSKKCALIAVDEILNLLINVYGFHEFDNGKVEYWKVVKNDIQKL